MSGGVPFVFGKLPSHGDFIQRGLAGGAQRAWDDWAGAGLGLAREALGERFEEVHGSAPPWRFAIGPGPLGPGWRVGTLAPSIDRVGRRFVVVAGVDGLDEAEARAAASPLTEAMEALIYQALAEDWTADALHEAVGRAAGQIDASQSGPFHEGAWTAEPEAPTLSAGDVFSPDGLLRMLQVAEAESST